jgi:hypothetical protein
MDNNQCINYAAMLLSGPAQTWWNHLEWINKAPSKWENMQTEIYERFWPINEERTAIDRIYSLKQYTTVDSYVSTFNDLAIKIPNMGKAEAFRLFMKGLKPEIQNEMEKWYIKEGLIKLQW